MVYYRWYSQILSSKINLTLCTRMEGYQLIEQNVQIYHTISAWIIFQNCSILSGHPCHIISVTVINNVIDISVNVYHDLSYRLVRTNCMMNGHSQVQNIRHVSRGRIVKGDRSRHWLINSLAGSALVQVMPCRLFGTKPLPEPMLAYCQLDHWEKSSEIWIKIQKMHSRKCIWKCSLWSGGHFVNGI